MKKILAMMIVSALCCSLSACSADSQKQHNDEPKKNEVFQETADHSDTEKILQTEGLKILCDSEGLADCATNDGYYYLAENAEELKSGGYGMHLMYMDFASRQEIFLCSNAGCKHDTADCPAVFLTDEFPFMSCGLFVYKEKLFLLSKEYDNEGAVTHHYSMDGGNNFAEPEASQAVLYEMNIDGTNRRQVYTFEAGLMVEDIVLGNDEGLYFVTKKLSATLSDDNKNVSTSADKKLVFLNMETQIPEEICSLDFNDGITWKIAGCFHNKLVLEGVDYKKALTVDDYTSDDDAWKELYQNSSDVIATLDLNTNTLAEKYRIDNSLEHSAAVINDTLYVSYADTQEIKSVHLESGEESILCSLPQNLITDTLSNTLCCRSWDMTSDYTYYFVNTETGEIQNSPLVNQSLGWSLDLKAEIGSRALVVYDYEAAPLGDDAYDITQYKYALIEKDDLYAGNADYAPIRMIGRGC